MERPSRGDDSLAIRGERTTHEFFIARFVSCFGGSPLVLPDVSPADGVTRYVFDRTQGPACAIAAGAATVYCNYFVPIAGEAGQTRDRQIDCLRDLAKVGRGL